MAVLTIRGTRRVLTAAAGVLPLCWLLVWLGHLDPRTGSMIAGLVVPVVVVAYLLTPFLPMAGRATTPRDRWVDFLVTWTRASLSAQLGWELPFVLVAHRLPGVTADDHWAWLFWIYGEADRRYLGADSFLIAMEATTVIFGASAQLCALWLLRRRRARAAALLTVVVGVTQIYGDVLYFAIAALDGFADIDLTNPVNLWFKFVGLNALWIVVPLISITVLVRALLRDSFDDVVAAGR